MVASRKPCKSNQVLNRSTGRCRVKKSSRVKKSTQSSPVKSSRRKSRVPCKSHQERNLETGRCRNKNKKSAQSSHVKRSRRKSRVPCKSHQERNPETGRCKNKKKKSTHPTKRSRRKSLVPCKSHQERNPETGRCRNKKKKSIQSSSTKRSRGKSRVPCKSHQERNPKTGRCINKKKKSLVREPVLRTVKSKRWSRVKKIAYNCVKRSNLPLRDLQLKVVEYMENNDGLIVVHGTGCGKTLTAITCSQCYLDKYPKRGIVFVGPVSLISNFKKEMKSYGVENIEKYEFYSYEKFLSEDKADRPISLVNKFLIVDEAHNIRNPSTAKSIALVKASLKADKRLLLTATPFVNKMTDFIPLINIVYGKMVVGTRKQFYNKMTDEWLGEEINDQNLTTFRYLLHDKVDMVDCKSTNDFPQRIDHYRDVPMDDAYYKRYVSLVKGEHIFGIIFTNPESFYNGYRRAVNSAGPEYYSSKIEAALPIFAKGKTIIFTNWVEFCIKPITEALDEHDITYRIFSGDVPVNQRQQIVDDFNTDKFNVLILTRAGGEGIDLKGVQSVVVLDPTWNDSGLQQVIGRAIRYKSHAHLVESKRKVNVYFMMLTKPESVKDEDAEASGDKLLYAIIEKKKEISLVLLELLKELSI